MSNLKKRIGGRLRALRKDLGLTLNQLAGMTELSSATLSRIENYSIMPSIQSLEAISIQLKVDIDYFFRREDEDGYEITYANSRKSPLMRKGQHGETIYEIEMLAEDFENNFMEPILLTIFPAEPDEDREMLVHEGQEFMYVLEGEIEWTLGLKRFVFKKGDAVYWNSTIPHSGRSLGKTPAKTLNVAFSPASRSGSYSRVKD